MYVSTIDERGSPRGSGGADAGRHLVHVCADGERYPVFIDSDGMIHPGLCAYMALAKRRTRSFNTRLQVLRGASSVHMYAEARGIPLMERFRTAKFLAIHEQAGYDLFLAETTEANRQTRRVRHLYARAYMKYLCSRQAERLTMARPEWRADYLTLSRNFLEEFREAEPKGFDGSPRREGLCEAGRAALVGFLADPATAAGMWPDPFVAHRNLLLVGCMALKGLRTGEWLSLKVGDVDLFKGQFHLRRQHDSIQDPRPMQPLVKGFERELDWPRRLLEPAHRYIGMRAALPGAASHDFLFVARDGAPMSSSLVWKVCTELRRTFPALGEDFGPHILRHTWNDLFTERARQSGMPPDEEIRVRMLAMGWVSPTTAASYTHRGDAQAANRISLLMQSKLFETGRTEG